MHNFALSRSLSNVIGAVTGAVIAGFFGVQGVTLALSLLLSVLLCRLTRLEDSAKSACVCAVIVMMAQGDSVW